MNAETIKYFLEKPNRIVGMMGDKELLNWMPDKLYLKIVASAALGYKVNLDNPRTYNEKLQWLKLYDRNPEYTKLVDKYAVRAYIAEKIGEEYLIPLVGGPWNSFEEIDFDSLPDRFVLKTTHDSGGIVVCQNKAELDMEKARAWLTKRLKRNFYWGGREWPYKNVPHRIIAEQYMEDSRYNELRDYKIYCFGGEPKVVLVVTDRMKADSPTKFTFFDMDFNKLPFTQSGPNDSREIEKPSTFEKMKELARTLSSDLPQLRVDFYDINGKVYFGEHTFFDSSGMDNFEPFEWDERMGSWIELPEKNV